MPTCSPPTTPNSPPLSEITAWNTLTATPSNDVVTSVGLFGADLTNFNADCTTLGDTICKVADYVDYNGWGVGVNFAPGATVPTDHYDGVAFTDSKWCIHLYWSGSSAKNFVGAVQSTVAISATAPTSSQATYVKATDAFTAWAADAGTKAAP